VTAPAVCSTRMKLAIIVAAAYAVTVACASPCPFGFGHHGPSVLGSPETYFRNLKHADDTPAKLPSSTSRTLLQYPPKVPGNPNLGETNSGSNPPPNNAFLAPTDYSTPISPTIGAPSVIDFVAQMGAYRGQELCLFNFQELPPPVISGDLPTVDLGNPYYRYPVADMERFIMLCDLAGNRMQAHVQFEDVAVLGGCAFGSEAAKAACHLGLNSTEEGSFCHQAKTEQPIHWPQAVTIFKFTQERARMANAFISTWLAQPLQHRPNTFWATTSGQGSTEPGNDCCGGVKSAVSGGNGTGSPNIFWGNNGGIFSKVVPCADIGSRFHYPKGPHGTGFFGVDAISEANSSKTFMTEVYEEWNRHCGIPTAGVSSVSDCTPPEPAPGSQAAISGVSFMNHMAGASPPPTPVSSAPVHQCSRCSHPYNAETDGNGVAFEDLPDTWTCPVCGAPKSAYRAVTSSSGLLQFIHEHDDEKWEEHKK